jgi:tRNA/tmRNA/rRNA uracil-C5-methylase (TrmA/RlmC/RlmD family)
VLLETGRYRLRSARALDMFPHTHHVEAMAVFDGV